MAKLTRAQRSQIEAALYHAKRAHVYIFSDSVAVTRRERSATTTLHYTRPDGAVLYEVQKTYGSDLCGLDDTVKALEGILEANP